MLAAAAVSKIHRAFGARDAVGGLRPATTPAQAALAELAALGATELLDGTAPADRHGLVWATDGTGEGHI